MTKEEKQLLLKDLCARLPYSVILSKENEQEFFIGVEYGESFITKDVVRKTPQITTERFGGRRFVRDIEEVKPYLRPMSSMTDEEEIELSNFVYPYTDEDDEEDDCIEYSANQYGIKNRMGGADLSWQFITDGLDWLNEHHFDFRGLIEKGLAIEAPEGMYKIN